MLTMKTSYDAVSGSNWSRKDTFSPEFTRARVPQSFRFHCHFLLHFVIQQDVPPTEMQIEPGNRLYDWIEKLGNILGGSKTLFLIDDIIADETLDKRRQPLLDLALSG